MQRASETVEFGSFQPFLSAPTYTSIGWSLDFDGLTSAGVTARISIIRFDAITAAAALVSETMSVSIRRVDADPV
jgi:hypothetical protein